MGKYFGTDGFRGEAGVTLTADHAYRIGRFLGDYFSKGGKKVARVAVGKDTRRSSYMLEYATAAGLAASGADVSLLHVTTTPSVSYVVSSEGFDCGIMISASHNPYFDNGIKLVNRFGEKMDESVIALIEAYLDGHLEAFGKTEYAQRLKETGVITSYICPLMYMNNPLCKKMPVITSSNKLRTYTSARYYTDAEILKMITGGKI